MTRRRRDRRSRRLWQDLRLRRKGVVVVAIPMLVLLAASVVFLLTLNADEHADNSLRASQSTRHQIAVVDGLVVARESDQRGYEVLFDQADLTAASSVSGQLDTEVAKLATMVAPITVQREALAALQRPMFDIPALPVVTSGGRPAPPQIQAWFVQERTSTGIVRRGLGTMDATQSTISDSRLAAAHRLREAALAAVIGLVLFGAIGGVLGVRLFVSGIARRVDRLQRDLARIDDGQPIGRSDASADELGELSRRMRTTLSVLAEREKELREARMFLESLVEVGPVVVIRSPYNEPATYVSPNCERVLGITPADALSSDFWTRTIAPDELARFAAATQPLFAADGPRVVDFEGDFYLGGRVRHVSCLVTREAWDTSGVLLYLLDTTARHDAERDAVERQQKLSAIATASPDIIVVYTPDLAIRYMSEAVTAVIGRKVSEGAEDRLADAIHPDDKQSLYDSVRAVIAGAAEDFTLRVRALHANGNYVVLEAHGRPLLGNDGAPVAAVAIFRDITDRIALEAELVDARDLAFAASGAKSEFLSRMSHELRTPLNVVLGFTQLLGMETLTSEQHDWIEQVLRAGRHLLQLINEVLDIARIESGVLSLSPEPVLLREVIEESVAQLRPVAAGYDVVLAASFESADDLYVRADRQRLIQVLFNLLANAAKYNRPHGTVDITARAHDDETAQIEVRDSGIGIAPQNLDRLFVPFDRLGAESTRIEGHGVGLPLTLRLVKAMDGDLFVDSTPGTGSTFTVVLPRVAPPGDGTVLLPIDSTPLAELMADHGRLLYIEDNRTNRALMQRIVDHRPRVQLLHASDGRSGLELARTQRPDLILLDLHLPDMHGTEVLGRLRSDPQTAGIPVCVVSADTTDGQVANTTALGACAHLIKPVDIERVLSLLDGALAGELHQVVALEGD